MKTCTKCHIEKDESEFSKRRMAKDGISYICKNCHKKITDSYWAKHPEKLAEKRKRYYYKYKERINARDRSKQWLRYYENNKTAIRYLAVKNQRRHRETLSDVYIKQRLTKMNIHFIPDFIELERNIITAKRLSNAKKSKNNHQGVKVA